MLRKGRLQVDRRSNWCRSPMMIKHEQEQTTERIESPFLTTTKTKELYLNFIDSVVSFCLNNNIDGFCFFALALWEITKQQLFSLILQHKVLIEHKTYSDLRS